MYTIDQITEMKSFLDSEAEYLANEPYSDARRYAGRRITFYCDPKDFRPIDWSKGKCPEAVVFREVDINGVPVVAS